MIRSHWWFGCKLTPHMVWAILVFKSEIIKIETHHPCVLRGSAGTDAGGLYHWPLNTWITHTGFYTLRNSSLTVCQILDIKKKSSCAQFPQRFKLKYLTASWVGIFLARVAPVGIHHPSPLLSLELWLNTVSSANACWHKAAVSVKTGGNALKKRCGVKNIEPHGLSYKLLISRTSIRVLLQHPPHETSRIYLSIQLLDCNLKGNTGSNIKNKETGLMQYTSKLDCIQYFLS